MPGISGHENHGDVLPVGFESDLPVRSVWEHAIEQHEIDSIAEQSIDRVLDFGRANDLVGIAGCAASAAVSVADSAGAWLLVESIVANSPVPHNGWCCLVCDDIHVIEDGMLEPSAAPSVGIAA